MNYAILKSGFIQPTDYIVRDLNVACYHSYPCEFCIFYTSFCNTKESRRRVWIPKKVYKL